jgi:hypothetical protein
MIEEPTSLVAATVETASRIKSFGVSTAQRLTGAIASGAAVMGEIKAGPLLSGGGGNPQGGGGAQQQRLSPPPPPPPPQPQHVQAQAQAQLMQGRPAEHHVTSPAVESPVQPKGPTKCV